MSERETIVEVQNLKMYFPITRGLFRRKIADIKAIDDISFKIRKHETLGLVGESGCGKTTTGRAILRLIEPTAGSVKFEGQEVTTLGRRELRAMRRHMQIVFQDPYGSLSPRLTVGEIVGEGLGVQGMPAALRESAVIDALNAVHLDPAARHRYPHEFSGGQRQRIAIARALVLKPQLIILDEPTSALDRTVQRQIIDLLRELQSRYGFACLFISHDLAVVRAFCHRVLVMQQGRIVECQENERLFHAPETDYTRRLLEAAGLVH